LQAAADNLFYDFFHLRMLVSKEMYCNNHANFSEEKIYSVFIKQPIMASA